MAFGGYSARLLLAAAGIVLAHAAAAETRPPVLDIVLGTHVTQLPAEVFVDPSCTAADGTTLRLWRLDRFAECAADAGGVFTIAFRHDDTAEYQAIARGNPALAASTSENRIAGAPAAFLLRVDAAGRILGTVVAAVASPEAFAALEATVDGPWACTGSAAGGSPWLCTLDADGRRLVLDWPGRTNPAITLTAEPVDPANLPAMALGGLAEPKPDTRPRPPYSGRLAAFMAGASVECPGCDLADADLRYRDLSGADLTDADLSGALLHGSSLAGANLTGAKLGGANLNRTDLSGAVFRGAELASAMIVGATAAAADFTGAGLASAALEDSDFTSARFDGASIDGANLAGATLDGASFFFATLRYATLERASFAGADLRGAIAADVIAAGARFAGADLSDAAFTRSDLRGADFSSANLTGADFVDTLLDGAVLTAAVLTDADFTGAVPPVTVP